MKILSIGNSFSQDAHKWLHKLAKQNGIDLQCVNLYIPGCSLETHWQNVLEDNEHYDLELNGNEAKEKITIAKALKLQKWDVVTVQQVSGFSGMFETYEPYLSSIANEIKKCSRMQNYISIKLGHTKQIRIMLTLQIIMRTKKKCIIALKMQAGWRLKR